MSLSIMRPSKGMIGLPLKIFDVGLNHFSNVGLNHFLFCRDMWHNLNGPSGSANQSCLIIWTSPWDLLTAIALSFSTELISVCHVAHFRIHDYAPLDHQSRLIPLYLFIAMNHNEHVAQSWAFQH